jgi:hypothetical protein
MNISRKKAAIGMLLLLPALVAIVVQLALWPINFVFTGAQKFVGYCNRYGRVHLGLRQATKVESPYIDPELSMHFWAEMTQLCNKYKIRVVDPVCEEMLADEEVFYES